MKNKFILSAIPALVVVFLAGITFQNSALAKSPPNDHLIIVKKVNGLWNVQMPIFSSWIQIFLDKRPGW